MPQHTTKPLAHSIFEIYRRTYYSIINPGGMRVKLAGNRTIHREIPNQAREVLLNIEMTLFTYSEN